MEIIKMEGAVLLTKRKWWQVYKRGWHKHNDLWGGLWWIRYKWNKEQENFASWCIKKRVDFFDSTEIGETYTIDGNVSKYKMNELLEMYRNTTQSVV